MRRLHVEVFLWLYESKTVSEGMFAKNGLPASVPRSVGHRLGYAFYWAAKARRAVFRLSREAFISRRFRQRI